MDGEFTGKWKREMDDADVFLGSVYRLSRQWIGYRRNMRRIHRNEVRMVWHLLDLYRLDGNGVRGYGVIGPRDTLRKGPVMFSYYHNCSEREASTSASKQRQRRHWGGRKGD